MPTKQSRRGRPKGSGLDDSGHISAIAALIAQNPDLKPTTAIKSLGISDPSTIRRLRDKYRAHATKTEHREDKLLAQPERSEKTTQKTPNLNTENAFVARQGARSTRQPRTQKHAEQSSDLLGEPACWPLASVRSHPQAASTTLERQKTALNPVTSLTP